MHSLGDFKTFVPLGTAIQVSKIKEAQDKCNERLERITGMLRELTTDIPIVVHCNESKGNELADYCVQKYESLLAVTRSVYSISAVVTQRISSPNLESVSGGGILEQLTELAEADNAAKQLEIELIVIRTDIDKLILETK